MLTSCGQVQGGPFVDLPPVRVIPFRDAEILELVIQGLLEEEVPLVPQSVGLSMYGETGLRASAVGAKSWPAFVRASRCFDIASDGTTLTLAEWSKEGRTFVPRPIWKETFLSSELTALVSQLLIRINRTAHKV